MALRLGAKGEPVEVLQTRLGMRVDGIYGPHTEQAVRDLQQETGCEVDGVVGPETCEALQLWEPDPVMSRANAYLGWHYAPMSGSLNRFATDCRMIPRAWVHQVVRGPWEPYHSAVNCVTFASGIMGCVFPDKLGPEHYRSMMLWGTRWANVDTLVYVGAGEYVDAPVEGAWHYWQGWRGDSSGHCGLAYGQGGDTVSVLESAAIWGPRWRGVGPMRSMVRPHIASIWDGVAMEFVDGVRLVRLLL